MKQICLNSVTDIMKCLKGGNIESYRRIRKSSYKDILESSSYSETIN
jgi:hypothetical protein